MAGFAFVNDMDLIVTNKSNKYLVVTDEMQKSLQLWHGLLQATAGDLVPDKSFWYLIDFQWEKNAQQYTKWPVDKLTLSIPPQSGKQVVIPQLETLEAQRTLGIRIAPDGHNEAKYAHLHEVTTKWK